MVMVMLHGKEVSLASLSTICDNCEYASECQGNCVHLSTLKFYHQHHLWR